MVYFISVQLPDIVMKLFVFLNKIYYYLYLNFDLTLNPVFRTEAFIKKKHALSINYIITVSPYCTVYNTDIMSLWTYRLN